MVVLTTLVTMSPATTSARMLNWVDSPPGQNAPIAGTGTLLPLSRSGRRKGANQLARGGTGGNVQRSISQVAPTTRLFVQVRPSASEVSPLVDTRKRPPKAVDPGPPPVKFSNPSIDA
jgi:hypothetical protein